MTPEQAALIERIRGQIADDLAVREVSMFGGRAVMVNEKMIVSVQKDSGLLVRVDADRHDELLERPGTVQAQMGAGRSMGPGWIEVAADATRDDDQLAAWVNVSMEYNGTVTVGRS
ncbi:TfoX/Sxy family protein [Gordonia sp. (in: high G+C Gram-positive bacteria)]|uniref:TfoX/Sxy family protein n=1 Tax=Gordonia sp. (in: high G+C Gram-positive bacteria) TaxID=84139 RepID=UPI003F9C1A88